MVISVFQMVGVVVFSAVLIYDRMNTFLLNFGGKVIAGFGTGLILGDPVTGLAVGAVLELLAMGIGSFGGASIPDYYLGAIMGTTVAVLSGRGADYGILVGVPLAVLAIQLDVLVRTATVFFVHRAKRAADRGDEQAAYRWIWSGYTFWIAKYVVPVSALFLIGAESLTRFVEAVPRWLVEGFSIAGGLLPAVGIAVLLRFMNTRAHLPFLIIGFALASFLNVPMIGVAVFGAAAAILVFRGARSRGLQGSLSNPVIGPAPVGGGGDDEL